MTKSDLVNEIAVASKISSNKALQAFDSLMGAMKQELLKGGVVRLPGIGTLSVVTTKARTGRNLQTGAFVDVPAGRKIKFSPSKEIKARLKGD